mmetsp:Transcript_27891/g.89960  ORF Transcript_27891/g.89960 Transcript_27891/m.89960 type:complete len:268 (+) Transcript_27891:430-1233(+)
MPTPRRSRICTPTCMPSATASPLRSTQLLASSPATATTCRSRRRRRRRHTHRHRHRHTPWLRPTPTPRRTRTAWHHLWLPATTHLRLSCRPGRAPVCGCPEAWAVRAWRGHHRCLKAGAGAERRRQHLHRHRRAAWSVAWRTPMLLPPPLLPPRWRRTRCRHCCWARRRCHPECARAPPASARRPSGRALRTATCSCTDCRTSSATRSCSAASRGSETCCPPRCSSTGARGRASALALCRSTLPRPRRWPSRPWTARCCRAACCRCS